MKKFAYHALQIISFMLGTFACLASTDALFVTVSVGVTITMFAFADIKLKRIEQEENLD